MLSSTSDLFFWEAASDNNRIEATSRLSRPTGLPWASWLADDRPLTRWVKRTGLLSIAGGLTQTRTQIPPSQRRTFPRCCVYVRTSVRVCVCAYLPRPSIPVCPSHARWLASQKIQYLLAKRTGAQRAGRVADAPAILWVNVRLTALLSPVRGTVFQELLSQEEIDLEKLRTLCFVSGALFPVDQYAATQWCISPSRVPNLQGVQSGWGWGLHAGR